MINKICASIDKNHIWHCDTKTIGRQGENICTQLEITLEECLCDSWVYLHFEKADGTTKVTEKLNIIDNVVIYEIGNDLLKVAGDLKVFVELHKESGLVWRSSIKTYTVLDQFDGTEQIENKEDFITNAQKTLNNMEELKEEVETGLTPTINENGNWEICGEDTGKPAQGPQGEPGKNYVITEEDYDVIENQVKTDIQPILDNNLKEAKDYTDNAIVKDFKDISYNQDTATFVFTRHDNTTFTVDLPIEQTVSDGRYDETTNELVLVLVSGQEIKIPVTGLIDDYTGVDSATIQCVISADNKITCNIIGGSITKTLLTTELQEEINNKVNKSAFTYDEETETLSINI